MSICKELIEVAYYFSQCNIKVSFLYSNICYFKKSIYSAVGDLDIQTLQLCWCE